MEGAYQKLENWLQSSHYTVVLTGAGMSTESGLPDFRSQDGLWHGRDPQEIASVQALYHQREDFIQFYRQRIRDAQNTRPHAGYDILTRWQRQGLLQRIMTQNVDGFHSRSQSHDVIELHGTLRTVSCLSCEKSYSSERYLQDKGQTCVKCSGFLRPDIVLFGEQLPEDAISDAFTEASKAELFIVLGSSLQVSPVNLLPLEAVEHGARLVIINMDPTPFDSQADLFIPHKIGEVLTSVMRDT